MIGHCVETVPQLSVYYKAKDKIKINKILWNWKLVFEEYSV